MCLSFPWFAVRRCNVAWMEKMGRTAGGWLGDPFLRERWLDYLAFQRRANISRCSGVRDAEQTIARCLYWINND